MKILSIDDVKTFCERHPHNGIAAAWLQMLQDTEWHGVQYSVDEFLEEADTQIAMGHVSAAEIFSIAGGEHESVSAG